MLKKSKAKWEEEEKKKKSAAIETRSHTMNSDDFKNGKY